MFTTKGQAGPCRACAAPNRSAMLRQVSASSSTTRIVDMSTPCFPDSRLASPIVMHHKPQHPGQLVQMERLGDHVSSTAPPQLFRLVGESVASHKTHRDLG